MTPARVAAFRILLAIGKSRGNSDALLHTAQVSALSPEDRNLTTALVMGVLRWQLVLDAIIGPYLSRPSEALPVEAAIAMRLGVFQLKFLERIPVHAAINESVELVKQSPAPHTAGLVNAVLRKIAKTDAVNQDPVAAHPEWMVRRWRAAYGADAVQSICEYDQSVPAATVRLADAAAAESLRTAGVELRESRLLRDARELVTGRMVDADVERGGALRIQDEGSQLIAELAGSGREILDCCAAPGGKTAILAERNPGARIIASDASAERLRTMQRLLRTRPEFRAIEYRQGDAEELPKEMERRFDLVLCDVPCSGTGTLARNPEIRLRMTVDGVRQQQARQRKILRSAIRTVKPGGRLVYSTCSLEPEENEAVVNAALEEDSQFKMTDMRTRITELAAQGRLREGVQETLLARSVRNGALHLLPGTFECDGFFAAILAREA